MEIQEATFSPEEYANAIPITDITEYDAVREVIAQRWQEEIIPLMS